MLIFGVEKCAFSSGQQKCLKVTNKTVNSSLKKKSPRAIWSTWLSVSAVVLHVADGLRSSGYAGSFPLK